MNLVFKRRNLKELVSLFLEGIFFPSAEERMLLLLLYLLVVSSSSHTGQWLLLAAGKGPNLGMGLCHTCYSPADGRLKGHGVDGGEEEGREPVPSAQPGPPVPA